MYQGWYNIYEGRKVSRVAMCEVRSKEKAAKNNPPHPESTMINNEMKWIGMNPIWHRMKKCSPSNGQNGQLMHWWLLVHSGHMHTSVELLSTFQQTIVSFLDRSWYGVFPFQTWQEYWYCVVFKTFHTRSGTAIGYKAEFCQILALWHMYTFRVTSAPIPYWYWYNKTDIVSVHAGLVGASSIPVLIPVSHTQVAPWIPVQYRSILADSTRF